jgi:hypothetical protein
MKRTLGTSVAFAVAEESMAERERIDTGKDTRYVRRDEEGKFKEVEDGS